MAKFEAIRVGQYAAPYGISGATIGAALSTSGTIAGAAAGSKLSVRAARISTKAVPEAKAPPPVVEKPLSPEVAQQARRALWWNVGGIVLAAAAVGAAFWLTRKK